MSWTPSSPAELIHWMKFYGQPVDEEIEAEIVAGWNYPTSAADEPVVVESAVEPSPAPAAPPAAPALDTLPPCCLAAHRREEQLHAEMDDIVEKLKRGRDEARETLALWQKAEKVYARLTDMIAYYPNDVLIQSQARMISQMMTCAPAERARVERLLQDYQRELSIHSAPRIITVRHNCSAC